jgi:C1A family cysteine protease
MTKILINALFVCLILTIITSSSLIVVNILEPSTTAASIVYPEKLISVVYLENSEQIKAEQIQEKSVIIPNLVSNNELYSTETIPETTNSITEKIDKEESRKSLQNDHDSSKAAAETLRKEPVGKEVGDIQVVYQTPDMDAAKDGLFDFSISIKCLNGDYCNNTILTLDPYESDEYEGYNFTEEDIKAAEKELKKIQDKIKEKNLKWKAELTPVFIDFVRRKNRGEIDEYTEPEKEDKPGAAAKGVITQKEENVLPYFFDWRNAYGENWVTSIKNQGVCNGCWAFATAAIAESALSIFNRWPSLNLNLSEQDIVSCSGGGSCGSGGNSNLALNYIRDTGIVNETCFPFSASDEPCSNKCIGGEQYNIDGYLSVAQELDGHIDKETAFRNLLDYGPSTAQVSAYSDMFAYTSGIYEPTTPVTTGPHILNILGYNETGDYLIVKNSWGTAWGINGFGYVKSWFVLNDTISFNILKFATGAEKINKGVIPMNSGEPFYTITQNPHDCGDLSENQTCNVTWQVNATGFHLSSWDFFVIIDSDGNVSTSPISKITIVGDYIPSIESIECESNSTWKDCSLIESGANLTRIRVNVTDENSNIQDVNVRLKENETAIAENFAVYNSGFYIFDPADKEMDGNKSYKIEVDVNDETYSINGFISFEPFVADIIPPVISNVQNSSITNESAVITWDTDEASNTNVDYGITPALGTVSEINDSVTLHSRTLTGLSDNTTYYYNVTSCDSSGNCATDGPYSFTTPESTEPPTISGIPDQNTDEDTAPPDNWIDLWNYTNDPDNATNELIFTIITETNNALIDCSIDSNRYIDCSVPAADQSGSSDVTVEVSDGEFADTDTFTVTVNPVDDPAVWNALSNRNINEDSADGTVVYSNLQIRCTDIDNVTNMQITSAHTHYDLAFALNDLIINNLQSNWFGTETVALECNGISNSFDLTVNPTQDCREICSYRRCYTHCE